MAQLTPDQMVAPKAIAPYEVALAFKLWSERARAEGDASSFPLNDAEFDCGGLGAPWPMREERPADFGERVAAALFTLIKEI